MFGYVVQHIYQLMRKPKILKMRLLTDGAQRNKHVVKQTK